MNQVPQVLEALDQYELRHLPTHLACGGFDDNLHSLLALGTTSGNGVRNAWFAAKEAIGDGQGYAADTALAARTAAGKAAAAVAAGRAAVEVGLEVRYALMAAALTNLTANLPGEFLVELVRQGRWSAGHALANARRQPNARARGRALALLSDVVSAAEQRNALEDALAIVAQLAPDAHDDELANERASVLVLLAGRLPGDLLPSALSLAHDIHDSNGRCRALTALAKRLDEDERRSVLREVLDAFDSDAADVSSCFELFGEITPDDLLNEIVSRARTIAHPYQRSAALVALLDRLPLAARATVIAEVKVDSGLKDEQSLGLMARAGRHLTPEQLRELVAAVPAVAWDSERIELWAALLPVLPAKDRAAALDAALRDAAGIDPEGAQFAVKDAATILPCVPDGEPRNALLAVAIEGLRRTQDNAKHGSLARLSPFLSHELLDSALAAVRSFGNEEYFWSLHARALIALGQVEREALEPAELERIVARTRQMKSDENREYVLDALASAGMADEVRAERAADRTSAAKRLPVRLVLRAAGLLSVLLGKARELLERWRKSERRSLLEMLAPWLRGDLGRQAIEIACAGDDHFLTGRLLTQLLPYIERHYQETVADLILALDERAVATFAVYVVDVIPADRVLAAVEAARRFHDRIEGAQLISALMCRLEGRQAERALDDIIGAAEAEEENRDMLSWYAELFCDRLSSAQVERVERIARLRTSPKMRFDTLIALLPRRQGAERHATLVELLRTARQICDFSDRRNRVAKIASELAAFPRQQLLELWHEMLRESSERRREELLADLAGLAPVVSALGGSAGVREAARAVRDVGTWWP